MELKSKIFAVSGAASGLGKATVDMFTDQGAQVIAIDLKADDDTLESWKNKKILYLECDVRFPDKVLNAIESGVVHFGGLQGAVACAGIAPAQMVHSSRSGSHSSEDFKNTVAVNLSGTFHLFNSCVPYLKENSPEQPDGERGVLIATSSIAGYEGQIGQSAYAASKGGVSSMVLPMARELARSGIRVNAIAPGIFQTPMVNDFPDKVQADLADQVPFPHRLGQSEEFAQLVMHILENRYINGTVIRLDGGVRMSR